MKHRHKASKKAMGGGVVADLRSRHWTNAADNYTVIWTGLVFGSVAGSNRPVTASVPA